jgi:hypothetical protein
VDCAVEDRNPMQPGMPEVRLDRSRGRYTAIKDSGQAADRATFLNKIEPPLVFASQSGTDVLERPVKGRQLGFRNRFIASPAEIFVRNPLAFPENFRLCRCSKQALLLKKSHPNQGGEGIEPSIK